MGADAYEDLAGTGSRPARPGNVRLSPQHPDPNATAGGGVTDLRLVGIAFLVALIIVGLTTVALHENHYKDRRWKLWEARLAAIETILTEDRRT